MQIRFNFNVRLVDYVGDPAEEKPMESWGGVEGLILNGAEDTFGPGTEQFLRDAYHRQSHGMKVELFRRYGLHTDST
jgi:hypothetical protein